MAEGRDANWRDSAAFRHAASMLEPGDDPTQTIARAAALIGDDAWLGEALAPFFAQLRGDPCAMLPFAANRDSRRTALTLFETPGARLSLAAIAPGDDEPRTSFVMAGVTAATRYLRSGGVELAHWQAALPNGDLDARDAAPARQLATVIPADGDTLIQREDEALVVMGAASDMVTLTATILSPSPPLMREYALPDGAFVRAASRDQFASRGTMLLTLLRVQGRRDAGTVFDAASRDAAFHTRWAAMREWLALDARAALPRLEAMAADDPNDEVRGLARTTLAFANARLGAQSCPA